jgi:glycerol-3-phosphate dehydrogenase (NAD(P)+)
MTVDEIVHSTRQVAEGVKSCQSIYELAAGHGVDMPIVEHVAEVVRGELTPREMLVELVSRTAKPERA